MDWTLPLKAHRVPTMWDVEEQATEIGKRFWKEDIVHCSGRIRRYWIQGLSEAEPALLQVVKQGERPDWRAMLKQMGSTWA